MGPPLCHEATLPWENTINQRRIHLGQQTKHFFGQELSSGVGSRGWNEPDSETEMGGLGEKKKKLEKVIPPPGPPTSKLPFHLWDNRNWNYSISQMGHAYKARGRLHAPPH